MPRFQARESPLRSAAGLDERMVALAGRTSSASSRSWMALASWLRPGWAGFCGGRVGGGGGGAAGMGAGGRLLVRVKVITRAWDRASAAA